MMMARRRTLWPWRPLLALAVAFLLLGAAGDGGVSTIIAFVGFALSIGGAGVGYGITKQKVSNVEEQTRLAHTRITDVKDDLGDKMERLTGSFTQLRIDLAESGVIKPQRREP